MKRKMILKLAAVAAPALALISTAAPAQQRDGGPTGAFSYATDSVTAATQRVVKGVVGRYQEGLNAGDFNTIHSLFAPDAVAEWNEKRTVVGSDAMKGPYTELFAKTKFSTDFQYDAVDIYGDVAIVRTHHPVGQVEVAKSTGKRTLDFNREIFVLRRIGDSWKIILYSFNVQPKQGEQ